jgi:DNA-directed RNA polymerase specialized sigma subunit
MPSPLFGMSGYTPPESQPSSYLEPHFAPHYEAWKAEPSPTNSGNLLRAVDPIVNEAIRAYGGGAADSPTLKGKAKRLTLNVLNGYNPSQAKLRTYLLSQLQGIRRLAAKEEQTISVPEQVLLDLGGMKKAENLLRDQLGRDPSDMELSDHTGLSKKRLAYIRTMRPSYIESQMTRTDDEGTSVSQPAVEQDPKSGAIRAWHDYIYHDLNPVDQKIMEHTLGLHNRPILTNQEIASRVGLSPGAISQRKAKIQEKLDMYSMTGVL